jgi:hypothetical protein
VSWFSKSAVAEVEPELTDQDKLAAAEKEAIFAESAWNLSVQHLRNHNVQHEQAALAFTSGGSTFIQTFANDAMRKKLEADVRSALSRRNAAWAARATLLMETGCIR